MFGALWYITSLRWAGQNSQVFSHMTTVVTCSRRPDSKTVRLHAARVSLLLVVHALLIGLP